MNAERRTILRGLTALALALLFATTVTAEEKKAIPEKPTFKVFGGSCLRSWKLLGTYETANAACRAVEQFRTEKKIRAEVVTGNGSSAILDQPIAYSVYRRGLRCGNWFLHSTVDSRDKVNEILKASNSELQPLELVYHFASAK